MEEVSFHSSALSSHSSMTDLSIVALDLKLPLQLVTLIFNSSHLLRIKMLGIFPGTQRAVKKRNVWVLAEDSRVEGNARVMVQQFNASILS